MIKFFSILILILPTTIAFAGNNYIPKVTNSIANVYDFLSDDDINVSITIADDINTESIQYCQATGNSSCQNSSGGAVIQTIGSSKSKNQHIVNIVNGNSRTNSISKQNVKLKKSSAQNCGAISCIQIIEDD